MAKITNTKTFMCKKTKRNIMNIKLILFILILFNIFLHANEDIFTLTKEEQKYLKENPIIKYTPDPNWLPYEALDKDGKHIGIFSDLLKLIEKKLNVKFEIIINKSWHEALILANENKIDMISGNPANLTLQKKFKAINSNISNPIVIIMKKGNKFISDLNYISDKNILLIKEYGYVSKLIKTYPHIKFKYAKNLQEALISISEGENDVLLASIASASYNISYLGLNNLSIVGRTNVDMEVTFFIKKDKEILFNIINKLITTKVKYSNLVNEVMKKWTLQGYVEKTNYTLIFKIISIFIIISLSGFIWNRQVSKSKNKIEKLNDKLREKVDELKELSITDSMTDLYNRRYFDKVFEQEIKRCKRSKHSLVLILLDVDKFKEYNDTYGHSKGDEVLIKISKSMKKISKRANDFAFRVGGEEFCLITSALDENEAYLYADKLREAIENNLIEHKNNPASQYVTASFGLVIAQFKENSKIKAEEIYIKADELLYKSKENGRNKIEQVIIK